MDLNLNLKEVWWTKVVDDDDERAVVVVVVVVIICLDCIVFYEINKRERKREFWHILFYNRGFV